MYNMYVAIAKETQMLGCHILEEELNQKTGF